MENTPKQSNMHEVETNVKSLAVKPENADDADNQSVGTNEFIEAYEEGNIEPKEFQMPKQVKGRNLTQDDDNISKISSMSRHNAYYDKLSVA